MDSKMMEHMATAAAAKLGLNLSLVAAFQPPGRPDPKGWFLQFHLLGGTTLEIRVEVETGATNDTIKAEIKHKLETALTESLHGSSSPTT